MARRPPIKAPSSAVELDDPLFLDVRVDLAALGGADHPPTAALPHQPGGESGRRYRERILDPRDLQSFFGELDDVADLYRVGRDIDPLAVHQHMPVCDHL